MSIWKKNLLKYNNVFILVLILTIKLSIESKNKKEIFLLNTIHHNNKIMRILDESNNTNANKSNATNSTIDLNKTNKSGGLSTGGIIAIAIPCILALIGAVALVLYCTCYKSPYNQVVNTTSIPVIGSSMNQIQTPQVKQVIPIQSQPVIPPKEIIIQPPQKEIVKIVHSPIQVYKEAPTIPRVNRVFDPLYPLPKKVVTTQQVVGIKQTIPQISQVQQVVEIKQTSPQISQVKQVVSTPKISKVQVVSPSISQVKVIQTPIKVESEPKITESYISISESKTLPNINTSQISSSQVLPTKMLPKITTQSHVLPLKILPPIDASINQISSVENIPQYNQVGHIPINNNKKLPHISKASEEFPVFSNISPI